MADKLRDQWANPSNILDLLLLVGSDTITVALAQLTGSKWPTPMVFSFGWIAYAFKQTALLFGHNRLLAYNDLPSIVINGRTGYVRDNSSWILGRLLRDFENGHWMDEKIRAELQAMLTRESKPKAGLCISLFTATSNKDMPDDQTQLDKDGEPAVEPQLDMLWKAGYLIAILQLAIAAIPWGIWGEWQVFLVTGVGTVLAFSVGSLQQWRNERWRCRRITGSATYILTRGNGSQHALVIFAERGSLNFEDLAAATESTKVSLWTKMLSLFQLLCWIALLVVVDGIDNHTWFLIAIGGIGMLYAIFVTAVPRKPASWGIQLEAIKTKPCIASHKVMLALLELEKDYPGTGLAILPVYFPGSISKDEKAYWAKAREYLDFKHPNTGSSSVNKQALSNIQFLEKRQEDEG